jgi:hypothetical protein
MPDSSFLPAEQGTNMWGPVLLWAPNSDNLPLFLTAEQPIPHQREMVSYSLVQSF